MHIDPTMPVSLLYVEFSILSQRGNNPIPSQRGKEVILSILIQNVFCGPCSDPPGNMLELTNQHLTKLTMVRIQFKDAKRPAGRGLGLEI